MGCFNNSSGLISNESTDEFKFISSIQQVWSTGNVGAGKGKTLTIEIQLKKDVILDFDSLWTDEQTYELSIASGDEAILHIDLVPDE